MTQNNIKIAITGGICSGKSTVAKIIEEQGFKVISCDNIYRELLKETRFVDLLESEFGNIKNADGTLDRSRLSDIVFNDSVELKKLNSLTHPRILNKAMELMSGEGVFFCEVPILFEEGYERLFDNAIVVVRDKQSRLAELMKRLQINENQALTRLNSQFDYENNDFIMYYVIHNSADLAKLKQNTLLTLEKIKKDYNIYA